MRRPSFASCRSKARPAKAGGGCPHEVDESPVASLAPSVVLPSRGEVAPGRPAEAKTEAAEAAEAEAEADVGRGTVGAGSGERQRLRMDLYRSTCDSSRNPDLGV